MLSCSCTLLQQLESERPSAEPARQALLKAAWMTPVPTAKILQVLYPDRCEYCLNYSLYRLAADALRCAARKLANRDGLRCIKYRVGRQTMWLVVPADVADHLARAQELERRKQLRWL